jgi:hypothetical protein
VSSTTAGFENFFSDEESQALVHSLAFDFKMSAETIQNVRTTSHSRAEGQNGLLVKLKETVPSSPAKARKMCLQLL